MIDRSLLTGSTVTMPKAELDGLLSDLRSAGYTTVGPRLKDEAIISTLERHMKCGIGKCQHCAIGRTLVCTDGPVYTYKQIKTLGEQI